MSGVPTFTIVTGGALGVDLEAEKLARDHGLAVQVIIPPCQKQKQNSPSINSDSTR